MPGYWKRPVGRMYAYNLDLGEHYYSPMTSYLESERGTRGETPGALTFSERLAKRWLNGRRYEAGGRYSRATSMARGEAMASEMAMEQEMANRRARAMSEIRAGSRASMLREAHAQQTAQRQQASEVASMQTAVSRQQQVQRQQASQVKQVRIQESRSLEQQRRESQQRIQQQQQQVQRQQQLQQQQQELTAASYRAANRQIQDDICKRVADIHMVPWEAGKELEEAQMASAKAKARIANLERELEAITRKAISTQTTALKTASALAKEAMMEDQENMQSSYKKSRRVMVESAKKVSA